MRKVTAMAGAVLMGIALMIGAACAAPPAPTPVPGVVIPFPAEGRQYRMSEVCLHLQDQGYEVMGTVDHRFAPEDLDELLDNVPALARKPLENYLADGLTVTIEVRSLCEALNK